MDEERKVDSELGGREGVSLTTVRTSSACGSPFVSGAESCVCVAGGGDCAASSCAACVSACAEASGTCTGPPMSIMSMSPLLSSSAA